MLVVGLAATISSGCTIQRVVLYETVNEAPCPCMVKASGKVEAAQ